MPQEELAPQVDEPSFSNYVPEQEQEPPLRLRRGKVKAAFTPEGEGEVRLCSVQHLQKLSAAHLAH